MIFPSNCSVASFQDPTHCTASFERKRFSTEVLGCFHLISWSLYIYKASSSFRTSLQLICCRNLFQNQSLSVLSSLLCVTRQAKHKSPLQHHSSPLCFHMSIKSSHYISKQLLRCFLLPSSPLHTIF